MAPTGGPAAGVRPATAADLAFLVRMVAVAADWRPGTVVRSADAVLGEPSLARYCAGWPGHGERGCVAETADRPVGAAWWRLWTGQERGYGFVAPDVPEVSLGVLPAHRGRGVGTLLMQELIAAARTAELPGLCLSVEPDNPASRLYSRLGFAVVGEAGGALTMLLPLAGPTPSRVESPLDR